MNGQTIGYVRVSTDEQRDMGESAATQKARIKAYCLALGLELDDIVTDAGCSAKDLDRPGMAKLLDGIKAKSISRVVVVKLDRLTRSVSDLCTLLERFSKSGAELISISESLDTASAVGRLLVHILGSVNAWEREATAERTSDVLGFIRRSGRVYGPTPFGFTRFDDRLVASAKAQKAILLMRSMRVNRMSYQSIAAELNKREIKPSRAEKWYASSVKAVLESRMQREVATT